MRCLAPIFDEFEFAIILLANGIVVAILFAVNAARIKGGEPLVAVGDLFAATIVRLSVSVATFIGWILTLLKESGRVEA